MADGETSCCRAEVTWSSRCDKSETVHPCVAPLLQLPGRWNPPVVPVTPDPQAAAFGSVQPNAAPSSLHQQRITTRASPTLGSTSNVRLPLPRLASSILQRHLSTASPVAGQPRSLPHRQPARAKYGIASKPQVVALEPSCWIRLVGSRQPLSGFQPQGTGAKAPESQPANTECPAPQRNCPVDPGHPGFSSLSRALRTAAATSQAADSQPREAVALQATLLLLDRETWPDLDSQPKRPIMGRSGAGRKQELSQNSIRIVDGKTAPDAGAKHARP
ncbi:uncharacterized protein THITE_2130957 [Thermothielavioides terrestris NRRL 8126]|uniref:Uncharacterized protein n=1 Tax=Thermothielavioides terrestris (strain ATCC 38088 / NRRL 8126) TaxID=578455 RepID=G2RC14_THETT|nr:uncharacterized protein THITE_2130957 [Thermothielavioides terrestris NRRL 8126]AEO69335.1 hypothetical protein THITE_2130957 [Thermothielavioides terrestris NRRL 8126]